VADHPRALETWRSRSTLATIENLPALARLLDSLVMAGLDLGLSG
jgi:hypothetical protein